MKVLQYIFFALIYFGFIPVKTFRLHRRFVPDYDIPNSGRISITNNTGHVNYISLSLGNGGYLIKNGKVVKLDEPQIESKPRRDLVDIPQTTIPTSNVFVTKRPTTTPSTTAPRPIPEPRPLRIGRSF